MRTKSLFHFTKDFHVLCSILKNGFWPRCCFEDIRWTSQKPKYFGIGLVCFCDISLPKLDEHTQFYGKYGIGMRREWGIENGLNPVLYISDNSIVKNSLHGLFMNPHPDLNEAKANVMITLSHTKPISGKMLVNGKELEKNFYEECEWRYVETANAGIFIEDIDKGSDVVEAFNNKNQDHMLTFEPEDIRYLLVEKEDDVPLLIDYINKDLDNFTESQVKILSSKIIILDELRRDL